MTQTTQDALALGAALRGRNGAQTPFSLVKPSLVSEASDQSATCGTSSAKRLHRVKLNSPVTSHDAPRTRTNSERVRTQLGVEETVQLTVTPMGYSTMNRVYLKQKRTFQ